MDEVTCSDGEGTKFTDCQHLPYGVNNCNSANNCIKLFCASSGPTPTEECYPTPSPWDDGETDGETDEEEEESPSYLRVNSNGVL